MIDQVTAIEDFSDMTVKLMLNFLQMIGLLTNLSSFHGIFVIIFYDNIIMLLLLFITFAIFVKEFGTQA